MRNSTLYVLGGPVTFRRGSRRILPEKNKKGIGWGGNLQNLEKSLREVYISDGFIEALKEKCLYWLQTQDLSIFTEEELVSLRVFAQTDQSGAEALIVAYDTENKDYRQLFIHGVKPHVYVALKLFKDVWAKKAIEHNVNIPISAIEELDNTPIGKLKLNPYWYELDKLIKESDGWPLTERYYYFSKQTCHSANYGIEWNTFIMNVLEKSGGKVVLDKEEGKRFLGVYRSLFPEIPDRCKRVENQVRYTGIIYNMFGFPFIITDKHLTDMKKYYAWGPQSTVGEITRTAITNMQTYIEEEGKKYDLLADTHDSMMHQCPLMDIEDCCTKQQFFMNQKFTSPIDGVVFNMKSETSIGFNWNSYKKGKNELGLRELKFSKK